MTFVHAEWKTGAIKDAALFPLIVSECGDTDWLKCTANVKGFVLVMSSKKFLKGNVDTAVFTKASPSLEAGLSAGMGKYGLLFLRPVTHQLLISSWKNVQNWLEPNCCILLRKPHWLQRLPPGGLKCVYKRAVTVTAEAPPHPHSWWGRAPSGRAAPPRTSWHPPVCWGWWRRPRQSPARPPGPGGRSRWPCSRAGPAPACCHLGRKSTD